MNLFKRKTSDSREHKGALIQTENALAIKNKQFMELPALLGGGFSRKFLLLGKVRDWMDRDKHRNTTSSGRGLPEHRQLSRRQSRPEERAQGPEPQAPKEEPEQEEESEDEREFEIDIEEQGSRLIKI